MLSDQSPSQNNLVSENLEDKSVLQFFFSNIKRTVPTALSYDFSIGLPILGIMMTRMNAGQAAPATTSMLNTIGALQFSSMLPCSFALGGFFGELETKEKQKVLHESKPSFREDDVEYAQLVEEIRQLKLAISHTPKNGFLSGMIYLPSTLLMFASKPILILLGQTEEVGIFSQSFFRSYAPFFLAFTPRCAMEFVLLTSGRQKGAMLIADMMLLTTIALQYGLAFKTPLGLEGLGLATGCGVALTCAGFSIYVALKYKEFNFIKNFFKWNSGDAKQIIEFLKVGAPIVFTLVSDVSITFVISIFAGFLPSNALIVQNVASQFLNFNLLIVAASSQTTALMVTEQRGKAKNGGAHYDSIIRAARGGLLATFVLQTPLVLFVSIFSKQFSDLIGGEFEQPTTQNLLIVTAAYSFIDGARCNILQTTRALGDNAKPSLISSLLLWLGVGGSYLLSNYTNCGVLGLPLGLAAGGLIGTIILANRVQKSINAAALIDSVEGNLGTPFLQGARSSVVSRSEEINSGNTERKTPQNYGLGNNPSRFFYSSSDAQDRLEDEERPEKKCPLTCTIL